MVKKAYSETPLVRSGYLSSVLGCNVYLKLENTQPSGSFKSRGLGTLVQRGVEEHDGNCHFFSSSGGNAGLAAATAAKQYNQPCTVVVPTTTKGPMKERIRKAGAEVVVHGAHWAEADAYLRETVMKSVDPDVAPVYCHPFDNPVIWEGHSTLVDELHRQCGADKPDAIVLAVGGGGLFLGVAKGLERIKEWRDSVAVVAVETDNANCFNLSFHAGKQVRLEHPNSIATTLGSTYCPPEAVEYSKRIRTHSITVSDQEAVDGVVSFAEDHKHIVEPACGAALAAVYQNKMPIDLTPQSNVVVVVCGGTATSLEMLDSYRKDSF